MDNTNENMTEDKDINKNNNVNSDDYEKICFVRIVCKEHSIQLTAAELIMKI